ncbi:unnamed protein product [Cuscuta campestris]|uniref:Protein GIGANTEA n=1 Tax=Cuscuta campestris TaxID=132261 RepID=A0A484N2E2_9ASTE|nr:unnamed protein product [Cuscuta campestris]
MHLHFLRAIGNAMSMRVGIAADAAAALLFRILSQPALLFPPLRQVEGVEVLQEPFGGHISCDKKQREVPTSEATVEATAQGIASMLCANGREVEWRICTIWEAAYGLVPLDSSAVDLPETVVATPLQPPVLSWNLYIPLLKVLEYLPRGSPSETCLMKIFVATVETILQGTVQSESSREELRNARLVLGSASKNLAMGELRTMVHSLFVESCVSVELASRLLFVVLTVCITQEAKHSRSKKIEVEDYFTVSEISGDTNGKQKEIKSEKRSKSRGPLAAFDSYVLAAVYALSWELQLFPLVARGSFSSGPNNMEDIASLSNVSSIDLKHGSHSAVIHTRRILAILEALFSLKPSSVTTSWSYSSNQIVAAAMVAAHISDLFRRSKACMRALSILILFKWDIEIHSRASSLHNLIDIHRKTVASIVNKAEPLEAHLMHALVPGDVTSGFSGRIKKHSSCNYLKPEQPSSPQCEDKFDPKMLNMCYKASQSTLVARGNTGKGIACFPIEATDLANFLIMDNVGFSSHAQYLLKSVLTKKQELCFSVVSLLWRNLIASPEIQPCTESTSSQLGWRQVVDALCNVVIASPAKAATAIVLQAEREIHPWVSKDDYGQVHRINQRIVKLIAEVMRNHDTPESLVILARASNLLNRATDGVLVDDEACTLPQLELLEVTARAVQPVLKRGESGLAVAEGLLNVVKCRIPATVRCLSHQSAHVRVLSTSVLRAVMHTCSIKLGAEQNPAHQCLDIDWKAEIEKCMNLEAHSRLANGLSMNSLDTAANELGCVLSV